MYIIHVHVICNYKFQNQEYVYIYVYRYVYICITCLLLRWVIPPVSPSLGVDGDAPTRWAGPKRVTLGPWALMGPILMGPPGLS